MAGVLLLLSVVIALATRCYCNTNTVMLKWSKPEWGPGSSAWKGLSAALVLSAGVTPMLKVLWSWDKAGAQG